MKRSIAALILPLFLAATAALAQTYPSKPVRVLIPWPPGGSNDIVGRVVFQKVSEQSGQQFIIDNRGGAAGSIGAEIVAKSPADGYTIMVHSATHVANAHLYKKLPYDTLRDFIGVTPLAVQVGMLAVHPSLPAKTVREFIALAKARPGEIIYGSSGNGSFVHLTMALLNSMTGTTMVHVPYKGGGPAAIGIASGETQAMIATIGALIPQIRANQVRPLGVTSATRVKLFPDVPTLSEAGVPGYEFTARIGAFAPAGTPRPIVDWLGEEIKKALGNPDVARILSSQTLDPWFMTPEDFATRLKADDEKYAKLIKLTGAHVD
ncbi:MAG: tripartite tricarboxylate transporter substrate binding protein [Burkholderiales bacterium]